MPKRARSNTSTSKEASKGSKRVKLTGDTPNAKVATAVPDLSGKAAKDSVSVETPTTTFTEVSTATVTEACTATTEPAIAHKSIKTALITTQLKVRDLIDYDDTSPVDETAPGEMSPGDDDIYKDDTLVGSEDIDKVKIIDSSIKVEEDPDEFDLVFNEDIPEKSASSPNAQEEEENKEIDQTAGLLEGWRQVLTCGMVNQFTAIPDFQSSLGLHVADGSTCVEFTVNGVKIELSLKVKEVEEVQEVQEDQESPSVTEESSLSINDSEQSDEAIIATTEFDTESSTNEAEQSQPQILLYQPLVESGPRSADFLKNIPCKFGINCTKGASCKFDHSNEDADKFTPTQKLCTWINTLIGCNKGNNCAHSHHHEGTKCAKSHTRKGCGNGVRCAFKHSDDYAKTVKVLKEELVSKSSKSSALAAALARASREGTAASQPPTPTASRLLSVAPPSNAPTGPKNGQSLGRSAGQKRGREIEGAGGGRGTQRIRRNDQLPQNQNSVQQDGHRGPRNDQNNQFHGRQQQRGSRRGGRSNANTNGRRGTQIWGAANRAAQHNP